jgi:hypothetical protein
MPSQLPQPALHVPSVQVPVGHVSLALARSQSAPQPPQLASVYTDVSQPFDAIPSQLPQPALQLA